MDQKQAFQRLKPHCVELIQVVSTLPQNPSSKRDLVQTLSKLFNTLEQIASRPGIIDAKLTDFVFVPISHVLRNSREVPVHALELCLANISILLRTGWRQELSSELSAQLLILFTFLASPSSKGSGITSTSEELQTAAFRCMAELLANIQHTRKGRQSLTETAHIPNTGKAVLVTVDSIAEVSSVDLRLQALGALDAFIAAIDDQDALASFLPRIISSLTKVLTPSSQGRLNFRLIERGIRTFSAVLSRALSDSAVKDLLEDRPESLTGDQSRRVRTRSWLQATASQIKLALANVFKLRSHDKKEVRHTLFDLCLRAARDCRVSLSNCTSMSIETLVTIAGADRGDHQLEDKLSFFIVSEPKLGEVLRESLHGWVLALPRLMLSRDDVGRRQVISQISTTLRLLNDAQINLAMIDRLLASNLCDSVANVIAASRGRETITEVPATAIQTALVLGNDCTKEFSPLQFRLKGQDDVMADFNSLLKDLAKANSATIVAQGLVNIIGAGTEDDQVATFWLSVNLLRGILRHNADVDDFLDFGGSDINDELLAELYSFSIAKLGTIVEMPDSSWHMQALALEVVAMQASRYKQDFRVELIDALYPILDRLGSPNAFVRNHAVTCLNIVAESCGYADASVLVISNVDYIVNAVGLKLNYHDISPQAPQVLLMMMKLCGPSLLPYLDDLVASMFSALERYHGYPKLVELLFSVLKAMAEEGVKAPQLAIEPSNAHVHTSQVQRPATISDVVTMLDERRTLASKDDSEHLQFPEPHPKEPWKSSPTDTAEDPSDRPQSGGDDSQAVSAPESSPPAPRTFALLLKISDLTQHYLTSSSTSLRTSLLSLLHTTIPALAKHEDSFLPLINTLWPVLLPRLDDSEAYIVADTLDIIALMCMHARNFMRSRIESIWEDVKNMHEQSLKHSRTSNPSPGLLLLQKHKARATAAADEESISKFRPEYVDTPTKMVREALIRLLCTIARHVDVQDDMFDDALNMMDAVLQREDVRRALESRNADAVWLRLVRQGKRGVEITDGPAGGRWGYATLMVAG